MNFRRYRDDDFEAVWHLHNEALSATGAHLGNGPWDEDLRSIKKTYLDNGGEFFVVVISNEIVAMGALKKTGERSAEICRMRVLPAYQRRGFGGAMLEKLESTARERGFNHIHLDTSMSQTAAMALYRKHGYRETGRGKIRNLDIVYFEKYL